MNHRMARESIERRALSAAVAKAKKALDKAVRDEQRVEKEKKPPRAKDEEEEKFDEYTKEVLNCKTTMDVVSLFSPNSKKRAEMKKKL